MRPSQKKWLGLAVMIVGLLINLPSFGHTVGEPVEPQDRQAILRPGSGQACDLQPLASTNIAHVWANEGGDKVWRSELRATADPNAVLNSVWDGVPTELACISLFGARNEVVAFNLVLESAYGHCHQRRR